MASMAGYRIAIAATLGLLITAPVSAQTNAGGLASVIVSGMAVERDTTASIAASIGYRLNPIIAVGIELTVVPSYTPDVPDFPTILDGGYAISASPGIVNAIFPVPDVNITADDGRATIFTGNLRLMIPTRSARISPYLVGGAGVANVRDELRYTISYGPFPAGLVGIVVPPRFTESISRISTDFAMTLGGGVSVLVSDRWSADADIRYVGVAGERDIHTGRYGAGITFRF